ncbi:MAG: OmpA family protein [Deltaproteobacteria bacterium]|nr:OmpA family protein [Deltaproteobacteria bacterium]
MGRTRLATVAFVLGTFGWLAEARAQTDWQVDSTFSVQLFEPAPGPNNFVNVEGTRIGSDFAITGGVIFNYQWQPFSLYACKTGTGNAGEPACELESEPRANIIEHMIAGDALFSVSLFKLFTAGLAVPFTLWQTGEQINIDSGTPSGNDLPGMGGLGDIRLHLKFRLWPFMEGDKEGFGIALAPVLSFPIGQFFDDIPAAEDDQSGSFMGSSQVGVTARVVADYYMYPFHAAVQIGYRWGEAAKFYDRTIEHKLVYGGAFGYFPMRELELMAEVYGWNGMTTRVDQSPVELDVGVKYHFWDGLMLVGGVGHGFIGIGAPQVRAYLGLAYEAIEEPVVESPDRDGDTILNENDACPDDAEDPDDYQDEDGCPELDNDNDGIQDIYDACPMVPEDIDGYKDEDGCIDLDHDEDGIDTPADQCPEDKEDFDGFADEDGCPDLDNDNDTIPDAIDLCTEEPEDFDGFEDDDGCPDLDNDRDGVPDTTDECAEEPETLNGFDDQDGCPDRGSALVVVTETQIEIKQQINFATDSDRIVGQRSFDILNVVAAVLNGNPNFRVEIQGHTDDRGTQEHNMDLSQRRAEAVRAYLIEQGVAGGRLEARGYGPDVPIEDNRTAAGREKNRRVEFHIIGSGSQYIPAPPPDEGAPPDEGTPPDEGGGEMTF